MASDIFSFKPAAVPSVSRGIRKSRYVTTVEAIYQYLHDHPDQRSVRIELGDVGIRNAVTSFRNAIAKTHPDVMRLVQRGGELYIERR